jgi:hypothetical protein
MARQDMQILTQDAIVIEQLDLDAEGHVDDSPKRTILILQAAQIIGVWYDTHQPSLQVRCVVRAFCTNTSACSGITLLSPRWRDCSRIAVTAS